MPAAGLAGSDFRPALSCCSSAFALPRVGEVIEERRERIQRDFEKAEKLKAETEQALANYERALAEARGKAKPSPRTCATHLLPKWTRSGPPWMPRSPQAGRCGGAHRPEQGQGDGERQRHRRRDGQRRGQASCWARKSPRTRCSGRSFSARPNRRRGDVVDLAEFWVAVSFVAFLLVLVYYKVPSLIAKALDDRAAAIRKELDEARRAARGGAKPARRLPEEASQRQPGSRGDRRSRRAARRRLTPRRPAPQSAGNAGAAHQAGRGEDRPRGGSGRRRRARRCRRHGACGSRKNPAREGQGAAGAALIDQSIRNLKTRLN